LGWLDNDQLYGGDGNDSLGGESGNDILVGGNGIDTLSGGAGNDTFYYYGLSESGDTITDFSTSQDVLNLQSLFSSLGVAAGTAYSSGYLQFATSGLNTLVNADSNGSAAGGVITTITTLNGVTPGQLTTTGLTPNVII
jgi:RTX calcium-binding nonapeptide repeat (4 copies)